jgi:apolipoprotein N-acyltransferase
LAADRAELIVLPEKLVSVTAADENAVLDVFRKAAMEARMTVIAGLSRIENKPQHNVALIFSPSGHIIDEYQKHHLVPFAESSFARGETPKLFDGPGAQWGVAICKDLDFPAWSRAYAKRGVRFLAVPAWDFVRDARLHSRMAVVRGIENGFTIARSAQQGFVTFSDAYGRILAEQTSATQPDARIVRDIPAGPGPTVYTRYGDWFGWLSVVLLCSVLASSVRAKRRNPD